MRIERRIERAGELLEHRLDLRLDVLADRRLDAQPMVQQDRAHLAPDHVGVVVGEADLLAQRGLRLVAQRRQGRDAGIRLFGEPRDREQERRARHRIGIERQALELGLEALGRTVAARAVAGGLLIELGLQHRQVQRGVLGHRAVDDRLDAGREPVLHAVRDIGAEPRRREHRRSEAATARRDPSAVGRGLPSGQPARARRPPPG